MHPAIEEKSRLSWSGFRWRDDRQESNACILLPGPCPAKHSIVTLNGQSHETNREKKLVKLHTRRWLCVPWASWRPRCLFFFSVRLFWRPCIANVVIERRLSQQNNTRDFWWDCRSNASFVHAAVVKRAPCFIGRRRSGNSAQRRFNYWLASVFIAHDRERLPRQVSIKAKWALGDRFYFGQLTLSNGRCLYGGVPGFVFLPRVGPQRPEPIKPGNKFNGRSDSPRKQSSRPSFKCLTPT